MRLSRTSIHLLARAVLLGAIASLVATTGAIAQTGPCCRLPDNGNGTIDIVPNCPDGHDGGMVITEGLPAGSTIQIAVVLDDILTNEVPGGGLGGTQATFSGDLQMTMNGTGALAGFSRIVTVPVDGVADIAPRTAGAAVQDFDTDLLSLQGQLFGDPDFCILGVTAGSDFGLPSPGHTTLTRVGLPGTDFTVDSFFDIEYRIDFQGCPGSVLDGMSGITQSDSLIKTCEEPISTDAGTWSTIKSRFAN